MKLKRTSGILMHITSLPGKFGIGDLGPEAYKWVDTISEMGCNYWQTLPTGPTGYADSPYQCLSAIAGNPMLISPDLLLKEDLINKIDVDILPIFPTEQVDFQKLIPWKNELLKKAFNNFEKSNRNHADYEEFKRSQSEWLDDYSLFMSIKEKFELKEWVLWPVEYRDRQPETMNEFLLENNEMIEKHKFLQFIFYKQWYQLKRYSEKKNVKIIGDLPIYVAHDSVDVWVNKRLFKLSKDGKLVSLSGVPPDFFSEDGQLWGNPIYKWETHIEENFSWWIIRLKKLLEMVDVIRIDHFRGFASFWEIPAGSKTARIGEWVNAPGNELFTALESVFGELPFIAEDLGGITPDVIELRDKFNLPGMRILQFAFGSDDDDPFLPHNYSENTVAYSGTHDNKTLINWYATAPELEREKAKEYLSPYGEDFLWPMIRYLWQSRAFLTIVQTQDFLGLGEEGRMNIPATKEDNWTWRMKSNQFSTEVVKRVKELNLKYMRL